MLAPRNVALLAMLALACGVDCARLRVALGALLRSAVTAGTPRTPGCAGATQ